MSIQPDREALFKNTSLPLPIPGTEDHESKELTPEQSITPVPPPNGGSLAWLQVAGAFFLFFNSWGVINTFGVFQSYYKDTLLPNHSASSISWIGTVQGFLLFLVGVIIGPIFDKGYLKSLIAGGLFFVVFGLMMTSLSTEYYQIFLAHGLAVGIGCGLLYLPSIAVVATYFTSRRAIAIGITSCGGSIGSVIYPIMFHKLITLIGFSWTTRIMAFVTLAGLSFSLSVMKMRFSPTKQNPSQPTLTSLRDSAYLVLNCALFFAFVGLYFPFFYLPTYFISFLHSDIDIGFYSLAILNSTSIFGRIIAGLLADRFGSLNSTIPISLITSILAFVWICIQNEPGAITFACFYGFSSGAIISLLPTIIARLTPDMSILGTRIGMSLTFSGIGLLIGNPIAGALLDLEHAVFWKAQLFSACMMIAAVVLFLGVRLLKWIQGEGWNI